MRTKLDAAAIERRIAWRRGLQVAAKSYNGVTVGYVVGWPPRYGVDADGKTGMFRNIRQGLIFKTETEAREFRDGIEQGRNPCWREFQLL